MPYRIGPLCVWIQFLRNQGQSRSNSRASRFLAVRHYCFFQKKSRLTILAVARMWLNSFVSTVRVLAIKNLNFPKSYFSRSFCSFKFERHDFYIQTWVFSRQISLTSIGDGVPHTFFCPKLFTSLVFNDSNLPGVKNEDRHLLVLLHNSAKHCSVLHKIVDKKQ